MRQSKANVMTDAKLLIIEDLYKLLFTVDLPSAPDNFDIRVALAKAVINHHMVFFKDKEDISGSIYWGYQMDVEDYFYDTVCPGIVPSLIQFERICDTYMDWDMWHINHGTANALTATYEAIQGIAKEYRVIAITGTEETLLTDKTAA